MSQALRILVIVAVFAIAAPPLGVVVLSAIAAAASPRFEFYPADLAYSIVALSIPAAVAGLLFAVAAFFGLGKFALLSRPTGKAVLGAGAMLVVFGMPVLHQLLAYGHLSPVLVRVALLSAVVGAAVGAAYPSRYLPARQHNAG